MYYLEALNASQRKAVLNIEGPMLINAAPGSGKTRVLISRIAFLIENKVDPFSILALTFTNRAAREMKERIKQIVGDKASKLWIGTFHSVFARILRKEASRLGYDTNFSIYDSQDKQSVIKSILKEMMLRNTLDFKQISKRISNLKQNLISWQYYITNPDFSQEDRRAGIPEFKKIYRTYCQYCFKANAMDFDDLIFNTYVLLTKEEFSDIYHKYQKKFQFVLIDEFQDTDHAQYAIIQKIVEIHKNICVVGDDAQSIYSFRGAAIENILNFEKNLSRSEDI